MTAPSNTGGLLSQLALPDTVKRNIPVVVDMQFAGIIGGDSIRVGHNQTEEFRPTASVFITTKTALDCRE
jgi:hypothetical protein